jgi:hypothetical protein
MERYERKNKGNPQRTPRSRLTMFPSVRGEMDWKKYRSRFPLPFPSKICKNHGRNGGGRASLQSQQWGRENLFRAQPKEEEGVFIPSPP